MTTKYSLLAPLPLSHAKLESFPFDIQALVDYLVLLKSEFFVGTSWSSFSNNIGARRHLLALNGNEREVLKDEDDGRSWLHDSKDRWVVSWEMREVLWP